MCMNEEYEILLKYMIVDFVFLIFFDKFKCLNVCFNNNIWVILDFSYYFYCFCFCDRGYYGFGKICLFCMEGGICNVEKCFF